MYYSESQAEVAGWLDEMEAEVKSQGAPGDNLEQVKKQYDNMKVSVVSPWATLKEPWGQAVSTVKKPKNSDTRKICCNYPKRWTVWFYDRVMRPKDADRIANSVDPERSSLIWVYTVCLDLPVQKLRIITVLPTSYHVIDSFQILIAFRYLELS